MTTPKLFIQNLSKSFISNKQTIEVLSSLNINVSHGEFVCIIGPSGCGKSTLFNIIAGIDTPTSGKIILNQETSTNRLGKSGYMLQKPLLLPWKTVEENIMIGGLIRSMPKKEAFEETHSLLKKFGLEKFAKNYPYTLSGGMAQRIAMLRTILFNKDFLLMDEPFGALDAFTRLSCQLWLLDVWKAYQSTILFTTHDISEAILLSDRIYVMSQKPAEIIGEFSADLPRPRKREDLTDKKAINLEKKLLKLLC